MFVLNSKPWVSPAISGGFSSQPCLPKAIGSMVNTDGAPVMGQWWSRIHLRYQHIGQWWGPNDGPEFIWYQLLAVAMNFNCHGRPFNGASSSAIVGAHRSTEKKSALVGHSWLPFGNENQKNNRECYHVWDKRMIVTDDQQLVLLDHCWQEFYPVDFFQIIYIDYSISFSYILGRIINGSIWKLSSRFPQLVNCFFCLHVSIPLSFYVSQIALPFGCTIYTYLHIPVLSSRRIIRTGRYLYCASRMLALVLHVSSLETNMMQLFLPMPPHTCRQGCQQTVLPPTINKARG